MVMGESNTGTSRARLSRLVSEALERQRVCRKQILERHGKQLRIPALIETIGHFFQVALKMLHADFVPRPHETALEKREGAFDRVRVDVPANVLSGTVIDRLMLRDSGLPHGRRIGLKFIREHDFHFLIVHIFLDVLAERFGAHVAGLEQPKLAPTLTDADDDLLVFGAASALPALHFAAYVGLIHFDYARKFGLLAVRGRHSLPDTHTEDTTRSGRPCRGYASFAAPTFLSWPRT